jgi:hypothetical protein
MSIFQGLFRKTNDNLQMTVTVEPNGTSEIISVRNEISNLKRTITLTNSRQRVSKKQRDALMTKVINTLDKAEGALVRASSE